MLRVMELIRRVNPPCDKCPYKLGIVSTLINPCPQCKRNGYRSFEWLCKGQKRGHEDGTGL